MRYIDSAMLNRYADEVKRFIQEGVMGTPEYYWIFIQPSLPAQTWGGEAAV